ncbi:cupin-like domain-containing protein [Sphingosinicella terrae]|uniref:cupin-like domain-containing protein n=1 Tax=Sphingosinicella terrae TaxID=2172047 RepID=UPI0025490835|nr:cupin-like domain-containing protein [Sphingosinicella terrae]
MAGQQPVVLEGVVADWALARAGAQSAAAAIAYLKRFDAGRPVTVYRGAAEMGGRFFYDETLTGFNFESGRAGLSAILDEMEARTGGTDGSSFYIGSTDLDLYLPGLRAENDLPLDHPMFRTGPLLASIWIGNRTIASTHYDMSNNLAACVVGRRRFTLFPPDQIANLYPGPLEPTPGGQVVSMVDLRAPDLERFPRFRDAMAAAQVADLAPGDLLFYPALWWHDVEAFDGFNVLINYWWNPSPAFLDTPMNTLLHAMLSLRDRPDAEKEAWRHLFDYYIFGPPDRPVAHLPEQARGPLAPLDPMTARRLRALLLNKLNR